MLANVAGFLDEHRPDALWLTLPNNPTGLAVDEPRLNAIARACAERGCVLVLDCCFRIFSPRMSAYDQYAVLAAAGGEWAIVEDIGKAIPSQDLKVAVAQTSDGLYDALAAGAFGRITQPTLIIRAATLWLEELWLQGVGATVRRHLEHTRAIALRSLAGTGVECTSSAEAMPVMWLRLPEGMDARELTALCYERSRLSILDGHYFFWNRDPVGAMYVRIAIARDPRIVWDGTRALAAATIELSGRPVQSPGHGVREQLT